MSWIETRSFPFLFLCGFFFFIPFILGVSPLFLFFSFFGWESPFENLSETGAIFNFLLQNKNFLSQGALSFISMPYINCFRLRGRHETRLAWKCNKKCGLEYRTQIVRVKAFYFSHMNIVCRLQKATEVLDVCAQAISWFFFKKKENTNVL